MSITRQFSSTVRMVLSMVMAAALLAGCGGGGDSALVQSQQTQISALKTQLASIQLQLTSARTQDAANSDAIGAAITSLTQTQTALAQLTGQSPAQLSTASNQVLVLQSLADSLTSTTATISTAYSNSQTSLAESAIRTATDVP